jgi:hypothetical protein
MANTVLKVQDICQTKLNNFCLTIPCTRRFKDLSNKQFPEELVTLVVLCKGETTEHSESITVHFCALLPRAARIEA